MQAAFLFFLAILVTLSFSSCGNCSRKIDCPGYKDDTLDSWFPYRNNQQLVFASATGQRDTFTLRNTETTAPYQVSGGILGPPLRCNARKVFQSKELDALKQSRFQLELASGTEARFVNGNLKGNDFSIYNFKADGLGQFMAGGRVFTAQPVPNLTIDGRNFRNVVEAIGDTNTTKTAGLYKLYYAKDEGLVSYSEYPSLQTWTKQ